jgi:hypothetical protein
MGAEEFEGRALGRPRWGRGNEPPLDVRAFPVEDGNFLVTAYVPVGGPTRDAQRRWVQRYRAQQITRGAPYLPTSALRDPPHLRLKFDDADPSAQGRARTVTQAGWLRPERGLRDPGSGGASLEFPLHKGDRGGDRTLTLRLAPAAAERGADLRLTLNDRPLPPLTRDTSEPSRWRTRGSAPVLITEVDLIDPTYTIVDFLADARRQNAALNYSYVALWEPRWAYLAWTAGSLVLIGGLWPTLIRLMIGAGFARAEPDPAYDLSRFKGGNEKAAAKEQTSAVDEARVRELAEELERKLSADASARQGSPQEALPELEPVRPLLLAPAEVPAGGEKPPENKEYGGEYYPVVRKVEKH